MPDVYFIILVFSISLLVAALVHRPVLTFAKKKHFYDNPEARKLQRVPIPVMGGFVVFMGAMAGSLCYWFKHDCHSIVPVQIAMLLMLIIGAWDDIKKLSPLLRFVFEILIVIALAVGNNYPVNDLHGLWGVHEISPLIAWPLTVFGCIGIINAINMIDGIDGLSSGICIMAFGFYGLLFFYSHDFVRTALAASIIGGLTEETNFCLIAYALAVLAIPVFDTVRVMFGRISRGESPFYPDKTHLHHAFIDYGFHHLETSLMEIILNMMIIGVWWVFYKSHFSEQWQLYGVIVASLGVCFGLYWMLGRRKRIAQKVKEMYGISMDEYEALTDEERKKLKKVVN